MSGITNNWAPCAIEWPKYYPFFCDERPSPAPKTLAGITSLSFRHEEFIGSGGVYIYDAQDLQYVSFPNLTSIETIEANSSIFLAPFLQITWNDELLEVDMPQLSFLGGFNTVYMWIFRNAKLTDINLPNFAIGSITNCDLVFRNNALTQSCVDNILAKVDASPTPSGSKSLQLQGGTNSTPSAGGLVSRASLIGKGWTVSTN